MLTDNLLTIGKLTRGHGVDGRAIVVFENWALKQFQKSEWVFLNINRLPVPFFISSLEILTPTSAIIQLEDIKTIEDIRPFINCEVLIAWEGKRKPANLKSIEGYDVMLEDTTKIGKILEVADFNGNVVARVKGIKDELWIPLNETTLLQVNHSKKVILISPPEGLLDLYQ
ncbi:MAG: ribosome maturation factor RimM [Bacteroidales bacterium]